MNSPVFPFGTATVTPSTRSHRFARLVLGFRRARSRGLSRDPRAALLAARSGAALPRDDGPRDVSALPPGTQNTPAPVSASRIAFRSIGSTDGSAARLDNSSIML